MGRHASGKKSVHGGLFQHTADQVQAGKYGFAVLFQTTRKYVPLSIRTEAKVQGGVVFLVGGVCVLSQCFCECEKQCLCLFDDKVLKRRSQFEERGRVLLRAPLCGAVGALQTMRCARFDRKAVPTAILCVSLTVVMIHHTHPTFTHICLFPQRQYAKTHTPRAHTPSAAKNRARSLMITIITQSTHVLKLISTVCRLLQYYKHMC